MGTRYRWIAGIASLALLLTAGAAGAQTRKPAAAPAAKLSEAKKGIGEGDTELGFFANYTTFDDLDSDTLVLGAVVGTFVSDSLQMRITPVISFTDSGGFSFFTLSPYFTVEYLFRNNSPVWPYVGGGVGINVGFGSDSANDTDIFDFSVFLTPVAGLKFFVSERMALEYALGLQGGVGFSCIDSAGYSDCYDSTTEQISNTLRFNVYY